MSDDLKFSNAKQLVEKILELDYFYGENPAIPYVWKPGVAANPLVLVVGENASGKSFFRRIVSEICRKNKVESIPISMEGRRNVAYNIGLAFVYGDEGYNATGLNSIATVLTGISTCKGRESAHAVIWDEPDIGLSDGNAASVGKAIADFTADPPKLTRASVVMTHRKALVEQLLPSKPHYLFLGGANGPADVTEWLALPPVIRPLEEVQVKARERFKAIQKILNEVEKKRKT